MEVTEYAMPLYLLLLRIQLSPGGHRGHSRKEMPQCSRVSMCYWKRSLKFAYVSRTQLTILVKAAGNTKLAGATDIGNEER